MTLRPFTILSAYNLIWARGPAEAPQPDPNIMYYSDFTRFWVEARLSGERPSGQIQRVQEEDVGLNSEGSRMGRQVELKGSRRGSQVKIKGFEKRLWFKLKGSKKSTLGQNERI